MPSKNTHKLINATFTFINPPAALVGALVGYEEAVYVAAGTLVTVIWRDFTPDLDVSARKFGWYGHFIGFKTYAELVPHRAGLRKKDWSRLRVWAVFLLSHIPIVGTLPRVIMLYMPLILGCLILNLPMNWLGWSFWFIWLGMSWGDALHTIADITVSDFKEIKHSFWRKRRIHGGKRGQKRWRGVFYRRYR